MNKVEAQIWMIFNGVCMASSYSAGHPVFGSIFAVFTAFWYLNYLLADN